MRRRCPAARSGCARSGELQPGSAPAQAPIAAAGAQAPPQALVLRTQHLLIGLGYPLGSGPLGGFGPRTRGAIEYFQRKYRLPVSGLPDPATVAAMSRVLASLRGVSGAPQDQPSDLVEEAIGEQPPLLTIAIVLALALALLALSPARAPSGLGGGGHGPRGLRRGLSGKVLIAVAAPLEYAVLELAQRLA